VKVLDKNAELTDDPRQVALEVLVAVAKGGRLETSLEKRAGLLSEDNQALAAALVYTCLRHQSRLDFLIRTKLKKSRTDRLALTILRLGLAQIWFFDRLKDYAVVSQTVELARAKIPGRQGMVNAILRDFLRDRDTVWGWPEELDGRRTDPAERLSVFYSHPKWLVDRLVDTLGPSQARALLVANNQPTPPTLRVNPRLATREELAEKLPFPVSPTPFSPWGLIPQSWPGKPESWPGFQEGYFTIQDEASQILGLLAPPKTRRILDACAGQGGKSLSLATVRPEAHFLAVDPNWDRLNQMLKEVRRLGLSAGKLKVKHAEIQSAGLNDEWDLVLVDAPCSGLGVIRRRPDLKWLKSPEDIPRLAEKQLEILKAASLAVTPGGSLIYSVCTLTREEGPDVMGRFLAGSPNFRAWTLDEIPDVLRPLQSEAGALRLWPHLNRADGFFYGLLTRLK
jgi:16S rRNA (cytosine967-C5)-methyltransferase